MFARYITDKIIAALSDTPVILLNGARQTGKSTLVKALSAEQYSARYITLDDVSLLSAAQHDPAGFVASMGSSPLVIDEVQRAPELFMAIKAEIDRNRQPGRFLLTGSANVLLLPRLAESLAGRMEILTLWPLSQGELSGHRESFVDLLLDKTPPRPSWPFYQPLDRHALMETVIKGGYPEAVARKTPVRRRAWFSSYVTTILQRDVRDLANINGLTALPRLLSLLAARSPFLLNFAEVSRVLSMPQSTLKRYLTLLKTTFLVHELPAWYGNVGKRLVKAGKLYLSDTGLMSSLLGISAPESITGETWGALLENFVVMEFFKQATWSEAAPQLFHFRTQIGQEVDLVLEAPGGLLAGIEIKAAASISAHDFRGLKALAELAGNRFIRGTVLYCGGEIIPFGEKFTAVPVTALWGSPGK